MSQRPSDRYYGATLSSSTGQSVANSYPALSTTVTNTTPRHTAPAAMTSSGPDAEPAPPAPPAPALPAPDAARGNTHLLDPSTTRSDSSHVPPPPPPRTRTRAANSQDSSLRHRSLTLMSGGEDGDESMLIHAQLRRYQTDQQELDMETAHKMMDEVGHKPYFTVMISVIQVLVLLASMMGVFGGSLAPWGIGSEVKTYQVSTFGGGTLEQKVQISKNMWFGPEVVSLIKWGAKFSPCMHTTQELTAAENAYREADALRGCCTLAVDGVNTCGMLSQDECGNAGGAFSGQGIACANDGSCEISVRPCCYGLTAECAILTQNHCDAVRGVFHSKATQCAEVDCLEAVCGLGGFIGDSPNQFWRFLTPILVHIGILHLVANLLFQKSIGTDIEAVIGFHRMALLYIGSGIGGNLTAGVLAGQLFVSAGASSSLYGLIGTVCVDLFYSWNYIKRPFRQLTRLSVMLVVVLGIGTLPYIDNYAHVGGFITGALISLCILPNLALGKIERVSKAVLRVVALATLVTFTVVMFSVFYNSDSEFCKSCRYINCIPWTSGLCDATWAGGDSSSSSSNN